MIRRLLLSLLPAALISAAVVGVQVEREVEEYRHWLTDESRLLLEKVRYQLEGDLAEIQSDTLYLATQGHLLKLLAERNEGHLADDFLAFCATKRRYNQIRFIDRGGMERVRVNFNAGNPAIVPPAELQSKAHRYYFAAAIAIPPGRIYVSPLDLNHEHHRIELPFKPVIRFATPVAGPGGETIGLVVLNYLARLTLDRLRADAAAFPGHLLLLDERGHYLIGFDREQEWGSMFPGQPVERFDLDHPEAWAAMIADTGGTVTVADGIYASSEAGLPASSADDVATRPRWRLVVSAPAALLEERRRDAAAALLAPAAAGFTLLAALLWLLTGNLARRRRVEAEIARLNRAIHDERDLFVGGPTVVIKLRNQFGWPVEYVSPNVEAVLGYRPEQFLEGEIGWSSIVAPEHLQQLNEKIQRAAAKGENQIEHRPYRVVTADGRHLWLRDHASAIRDQSGRISHFHGYVNDVTEAVEAERRLEHSRNYVQTVIDSIADPTLVIDLHDFRLLLTNRAARRLYLEEGEALTPGLTCHRLSHHRDQPCTGADDPCPLPRLLESRAPVRLEHRHYSADGRELFVELIATPILDERGRVVQVVESHRDITERRAMEEALRLAMRTAEEANRAKSTFLANMSHDIRTPLNAVIGMGELLQETRLDPQQRRWVATMNRAGETLLALINDVLDLSKIEAGEFTLEAADFDLHELAQATTEILAVKAEEKGIKLRCRIAPELPRYVHGDGDRLRQILLNLLGNAVKFTELGGVTLLLTPGEGEEVCFAVADTGIGIPPERLERVFDPFIQAEADTTRRFGGTGLGLAICRELTRRLGGRIWAESEPGLGSTFHLRLPLPAGQPTAATARPVATAADGRALRILLVDDSEESRTLILAFLRHSPHRLETAENGAQGVARFQAGEYDLVLMDMEMPVLDGAAACRRIREWERAEGRPRTPIVALTAHALKEDRRRSQEAGCDEHLTKPLRKRRLLEAVARFGGTRPPDQDGGSAPA